ncbi:MAG: hypothetical protein QOH59_3068 [Gemmatimonadales bacterium]|jgi:hypothetical protein|nr:hypothetical protein [Gemmatimonadales bacterium]
MNEKSGFVPEFLAYLSARKWLVLAPIVAIGLMLILAALLLFGPGAALEALYQIF